MPLSKELKDKLEGLSPQQKGNLSDLMAAHEQGADALLAAMKKIWGPVRKNPT